MFERVPVFMMNMEPTITEQTAQEVESMTDDELRNAVSMSSDNVSIAIPGVIVNGHLTGESQLTLHHFWIPSKIQGQGIGTIVLEEIIENARRDDSIETVVPTVQRSDGSVRGLLEKLDFNNIMDYKSTNGDKHLVEGTIDVS